MKSSDSAATLTVKILGRDYQVACPPDERDQLLASARYLDARMQAIRKRAAGLGIERIAVMAALNMARELMDERAEIKPDVTPSKVVAIDEADRIEQMSLRIDAELAAD